MLKRFDVDVVHLVDPIKALGPRKNADQRLAQAEELTRSLRQHGITLVQTIFPGRSSAAEGWQQVLDEATCTFITPDDVTVTPDRIRTTVIPHSHYRGRFLGYPRAEQLAGRLLSVSRTGLRGAAQGPLKVFSITDTPDISLRIVGDPDPLLRDLLTRASRRNPDTVSAKTGYVSDAELVHELSAAELVFLPDPESLDELSLIFMALSLDRPIVVPQSPTTDRIAEQVGPGWVHLLTEPMTAERLDDTITFVRNTPRSPRPDLDGRDPEAIALRYQDVFGR